MSIGARAAITQQTRHISKYGLDADHASISTSSSHHDDDDNDNDGNVELTTAMSSHHSFLQNAPHLTIPNNYGGTGASSISPNKEDEWDRIMDSSVISFGMGGGHGGIGGGGGGGGANISTLGGGGGGANQSIVSFADSSHMFNTSNMNMTNNGGGGGMDCNTSDFFNSSRVAALATPERNRPIVDEASRLARLDIMNGVTASGGGGGVGGRNTRGTGPLGVRGQFPMYSPTSQDETQQDTSSELDQSGMMGLFQAAMQINASSASSSSNNPASEQQQHDLLYEEKSFVSFQEPDLSIVSLSLLPEERGIVDIGDIDNDGISNGSKSHDLLVESQSSPISRLTGDNTPSPNFINGNDILESRHSINRGLLLQETNPGHDHYEEEDGQLSFISYRDPDLSIISQRSGLSFRGITSSSSRFENTTMDPGDHIDLNGSSSIASQTNDCYFDPNDGILMDPTQDEHDSQTHDFDLNVSAIDTSPSEINIEPPPPSHHLPRPPSSSRQRLPHMEAEANLSHQKRSATSPEPSPATKALTRSLGLLSRAQNYNPRPLSTSLFADKTPCASPTRGEYPDLNIHQEAINLMRRREGVIVHWPSSSPDVTIAGKSNPHGGIPKPRSGSGGESSFATPKSSPRSKREHSRQRGIHHGLRLSPLSMSNHIRGFPIKENEFEDEEDENSDAETNLDKSLFSTTLTEIKGLSSPSQIGESDRYLGHGDNNDDHENYVERSLFSSNLTDIPANSAAGRGEDYYLSSKIMDKVQTSYGVQHPNKSLFSSNLTDIPVNSTVNVLPLNNTRLDDRHNGESLEAEEKCLFSTNLTGIPVNSTFGQTHQEESRGDAGKSFFSVNLTDIPINSTFAAAAAAAAVHSNTNSRKVVDYEKSLFSTTLTDIQPNSVVSSSSKQRLGNILQSQRHISGTKIGPSTFSNSSTQQHFDRQKGATDKRMKKGMTSRSKKKEISSTSNKSVLPRSRLSDRYSRPDRFEDDYSVPSFTSTDESLHRSSENTPLSRSLLETFESNYEQEHVVSHTTGSRLKTFQA